MITRRSLLEMTALEQRLSAGVYRWDIERAYQSTCWWWMTLGCVNYNELDYVVQSYISRLRRKIEDNISTPVHLLRVPGFRYSFCSQSRPGAQIVAVEAADRVAGSPFTSDATPAKEDVERILCLSLRRLRKAIQNRWISFPSQVPVFARESRADIQWRLAELYFVRNWSCSDLGHRYGVTMERVRQLLCGWVRRAALLGYLQEIPAESG